MTVSLCFLKLGGSAITDKTREATPRPDVIREAARAIRAAHAADPALQLLLGHGSGSFGHFTAAKWGFGQQGNWRAYAETGASAARLNRLVTDILLEQGLPVVSLQPSASAVCRGGQLVTLASEPARMALDHGLIPLIYGDVAFDESLGMSIVSTDALFSYLAPLLRPSRIVFITAVSGIYTADPLTHPDAYVLRELNRAGLERLSSTIGGSHGTDVTGGMWSKVQHALALAAQLPEAEIYITGPTEIEDALTSPNFRAGTRLRGV